MSSLFVRWLGDGFDPKSPMTRRINGVCTHANGSEKNTHKKPNTFIVSHYSSRHVRAWHNIINFFILSYTISR